MVIAAYAAAGKTTFAQRVEGAIDLVSMPHSWCLPPSDGKSGEFEAEKGARYLLRDPRYPSNYILEILKAEQEYPYVLIPTNAGIIERLREKYSRQVLLCYPTKEQKEDYRARFLARGNSEEFLKLFIDDWEYFLTPFWDREVSGIHLPLRPGEYLTDVKGRIDQAAEELSTAPVPQDLIEELTKKQSQERDSFALYLSGNYESMIYRIHDIEDPEERAFLYRITRMAYEKTDQMPYAMPRKIFENHASGLFWTDDREETLRFIEER